MKITTVTYSRTYPTGLYANEKIGVEATIDETDNVDQVFDMLKGICDGQHKSNNPHLYTETPVTTVHVSSQWEKQQAPEPEITDSPEEGTRKMIKEAVTLKGLSFLKPLLNKYPNLKEEYEQKLKELSI